MPEKEKVKKEEPLKTEESFKEDLVNDLLPDELRFICSMCHIAANKRMVKEVSCGDKNITGQYCKQIDRLRRALIVQSSELEASRKYIHIFIKFMGGINVFRKQELKTMYDEYSVKKKPDFDEFLDYCRMNGIEILE